MQLTFWHKARYWVLLLIITLITVAFHPMIIDMGKEVGLESGNILSPYIVMAFLVLFGMCFNIKEILKNKVIRVSLFIVLFIFVYYMITRAAFGRRTMMSDLRSIGICLVGMMIGWQLDLDEKRYKIALLLFAGLITLMGLLQVTMHVGGFEILDQSQVEGKNSMGVLLATSSVIYLFFGLNVKSKPIVKVLFFALTVFVVVILLTIRARAATLTSAILILFVLYQRFKGKNFFFYLIIGLFLMVVAYLVLPEYAKQYVINSFVQNQEGDITSSRMYRNRAGLAFISDHPLFGNLNVDAEMDWIHNYPLLKLFQFGFVFAFPIMLLYLYLLFYSVVKTSICNNRNNYNIGYFALLVPFVVSMAEPTLPFGPGTATLFNFILFGMATRNTYNEKFGLVNSEI